MRNTVLVSRGTWISKTNSTISRRLANSDTVYDNEPGGTRSMNLSTRYSCRLHLYKRTDRPCFEAADHHHLIVEGRVLEPTSSY